MSALGLSSVVILICGSGLLIVAVTAAVYFVMRDREK